MWKFEATPRELQFLVVGAIAGVVGTLIGKAASFGDGGAFVALVSLAGAFVILGFARTGY